MNREYPARPKVAAWARYPRVVLGVACIIGGIDSLRSSPLDLYPLVGGFLVGGAWFAFGFYGGHQSISWDLGKSVMCAVLSMNSCQVGPFR
jgi:hypothetical protein